ncbi:MAG: SgcJ/EcaC family oxidoreductase [Candidatus Acidiferrales bacterium]
MPRRLLPFAVFVLFSAALLKTAVARQTDSAAEAIKAVHAQWAVAWKNHDIDGLRALYAPDAILLPSNDGLVEGPDKIADHLRGMIEASPNNGAFFFVSDAIETSGDLAYDCGFIQYWPTGRVAPVKGFYILILKRDASRNWLISRHVFTQISATPSILPARHG